MDTSRRPGCSRLRAKLAEDVMQRVPALIEKLPPTARDAAGAAWRDYGEVVCAALARRRREVSDRYAAEHLEVHARDLDWWLAQPHLLRVAFPRRGNHGRVRRQGFGPNHILPTKRCRTLFGRTVGA